MTAAPLQSILSLRILAVHLILVQIMVVRIHQGQLFYLKFFYYLCFMDKDLMNIIDCMFDDVYNDDFVGNPNDNLIYESNINF